MNTPLTAKQLELLLRFTYVSHTDGFTTQEMVEVAHLQRLELVYRNGLTYDYKVSARGEVYLNAVMALQLPAQSWVMP